MQAIHGASGARAARRFLLMLLIPLAACSGRAESQGAGPLAVPLYHDLGEYAYAVETRDPLAQQYFDQGLRLYYAFNHAESIRAFSEAARIDPDCAMCQWGIALALGPNINMPMDPADGAAAWAAVREALRLSADGPPAERALIEALSRRYAAEAPADRAGLDSAYARAMQDVARQFDGDPEARTLYAEALMVLSPWEYWDRDGSPRPDTPGLLAALESVLATHTDHPGANHLYIHAVEAVDPQRAVPMAERLAALMPGAGHIVHMPGHIYIRVGRYLDAIRANEHAVHADETYIRDQNPGAGIYTVGYYPHNYDFLAFAASMIGRERQAIDAADRIAALVPEEMLRAPGMTLLQNFLARGLQMRVRFSRWEEILTIPGFDDDLLYARAILHYARGRAFAATNRAGEAAAEFDALRSLARAPELAEAGLEFNAAADILGIAVDVLAGHVAQARGDHASAIAALRSAVGREDALVYGEPPEWSVPVRQELGAALLVAGRAADATAVFREELRHFPDNVWSLDGLARSLAAQGRSAEAAETERRLTELRRLAQALGAHDSH
jgi:tetratricopeptide (TPR) repeat protein